MNLLPYCSGSIQVYGPFLSVIWGIFTEDVNPLVYLGYLVASLYVKATIFSERLEAERAVSLFLIFPC